MPQIDFSGSHAIADSMKDLGAGMARIGHVLQYEAEKQQDADRAVFSARWAADASKNMDAALTAMENTPYEDIQAGKFTLLKKLRESLLQDVQAEPDRKLRALKEKSYLHLAVAAEKAVSNLVQKKRVDWGKAGIMQGAESSLIAFSREADPAEQQRIADEHALKVLAAQQGGILTEQEAQHHLVQYNEKTLELRADGMIRGNRFDDAAAFVEINRIMLGGKYGELIGKIDRRRAEVAEAGAYADAAARWPDPRQAMVEVLKPEFLQKHGLTVNQSQNLEQSFSKISAQMERERMATFYETATNIFLNLKTMTPRKIDDAVANGLLDYKTAEHFKTELRRGDEGRTDPATYDRFLQAIYSDAKGPEAIRMEIYRTGGLSRADKEKLLTKTEAKIEKIDARNLTRAMQYLKETVMPSQTMVTAAKPDEALNYLKATEAMEAAVAEARKAGKPLSSKQVIETAHEISQTFKMSTREQMEAARKRMQEDAKKVKPAQQFGPAKQPQAGPRVLKYNPATGMLE